VLSLTFLSVLSLTFLSVCATLFRARRTAAGRWDAEEGHGDPSQACICLMPAGSAVWKDLDAHLGGF
jgi:hypothetical protein